VHMFDPLLFADWRSIARALTVICWLLALVLAGVIVGHVTDVAPAHHAGGHVVLAR
jgi:hypothetical protein